MPPSTIAINDRPHTLSRNAVHCCLSVARGIFGYLLRQAMNQVTAASIKASITPGTMPAMNSAPIEVLVETPYSTRMIEGGTRMPSAPEVEITPDRKRRG